MGLRSLIASRPDTPTQGRHLRGWGAVAPPQGKRKKEKRKKKERKKKKKEEKRKKGTINKTATAGPSYTKGRNVWYVMGISKKA